MSGLDEATLVAAFQAHTAGADRFTRRMAIVLAGMADVTPRQIVLRLERLGLLKSGSWEWFQSNGGITREHHEEVKTDLARRQIPQQPEPCISGRCYSPYACEGWGYCRDRNDFREPTQAERAERLALARAAKAAASSIDGGSR